MNITNTVARTILFTIEGAAYVAVALLGHKWTVGKQADGSPLYRTEAVSLKSQGFVWGGFPVNGYAARDTADNRSLAKRVVDSLNATLGQQATPAVAQAIQAQAQPTAAGGASILSDALSGIGEGLKALAEGQARQNDALAAIMQAQARKARTAAPAKAKAKAKARR